MSEPDARRAVKVSSLSDEAKETAREVGLQDNRSALLKATKAQEQREDSGAGTVQAPDSHGATTLWEIDENLMRAELSAAEQAYYLKRRKQLWASLNSQDDDSDKDSGGNNFPTRTQWDKGFAGEVEEKTGRSKRGVNQSIHRAEKLGDETIERDQHVAEWISAENLHRADLTAQQRNDQIAEWIKLTEQKQERDKNQNDISVQAGPKLGRKPSGVSAAARELGVSETAAKRAVKIADLPDDVKEAAREAGLDKYQTHLREASSR